MVIGQVKKSGIDTYHLGRWTVASTNGRRTWKPRLHKCWHVSGTKGTKTCACFVAIKGLGHGRWMLCSWRWPFFSRCLKTYRCKDSNAVQYKSRHNTSSKRPVRIVSLFNPNLYHNNGTISDEWRDCQYPKTDVLRNLYRWIKADSARINIYPHEPEDMTVAREDT